MAPYYVRRSQQTISLLFDSIHLEVVISEVTRIILTQMRGLPQYVMSHTS